MRLMITCPPSIHSGATSRAGALLLVCGTCLSANGAVFEVNRVDAGGVVGQSFGNAITWSPANLAYNPGTGSNFPPHPRGVELVPGLGSDSYLAIDPFGPTIASSGNSEEGYYCQGPSNLLFPTAAPTTLFSAGSLQGIWFKASPSGGFVSSYAVERPLGYLVDSPNDLFIAQVTLRPGTSAPTTTGLGVNIRDFGTANPLGQTGLLKFGIDNATDNNGLWGQSYYLDVVARTVSGVNSTFNGGTSYAIYIVAVPAPGSAATLALMGALALRRRRE